MLIGLGTATMFVIYNMYSKAAILTMMSWFIIWCVGYRRYGLGLFIALAFLGINLLRSDVILNEAGRLFEQEFAGVASDATGVEQRRLLAGRVGVWEQMLVQFSSASTIEQFFGQGAAKGAHNDYLQKLFSGGFFGLGIIRRCWRGSDGASACSIYGRGRRSTLWLVLAFCGWMIDTHRCRADVYPAYQWYAWGLIGLAIKGLDLKQEAPVANEKRGVEQPIWLQGKQH